MTERNTNPISLWARLGVSISVTQEELTTLLTGGNEAKNLMVSLIQSERCVLDGETYFPCPANENYISDDLEFDFNPTSLHSKETRKPSLNEQIHASEARAASQNISEGKASNLTKPVR